MLAISGGKIHTVTGPTLEQGTILIKQGKIIAVGDQVEIPAGCPVVDATDQVLMPGLIDTHSHVGIFEEIHRIEGGDGNETTDPITPYLRAIDAINPDDLAFSDAVAGGVTTVAVAPGSANVIGGTMVAMKTAGRIVDQMVIKNPVGMKAALGENPKRVYGAEKKTPSTRMASAALLRKTLVETLNYINKAPQERDFTLENLVPVLEGKLPLRVHAHRADDIVTAIRIADEFNIKLVLEHCTEGYKVADLIAAKQIPAIIGPIITNRSKVEMQGVALQNAYQLQQAGVKFAIMTDHPVVPIQYLALSAALTVRGGLSEAEAIKAITIQPAEILGLANQIGSIEVGKDADLVLLDREIFDVRCRIKQVYIKGISILQKSEENVKIRVD